MTRAQIIALEKAWASQDPKDGYDRVAMVLSVEDACDDGAEVRAHIELPPAVVLWLLRNLAQFVNLK
jgi:hypothetical protein